MLKKSKATNACAFVSVVIRRLYDGLICYQETQTCGCARSDTYAKRMGANINHVDLPLIQLSDLPGHHRTADLTGLVFNRLTVVSLDKAYMRDCGKVAVIWKCRCECGNECDVSNSCLVHGMTSSCGCLKQSKRELFVVQYFDSLGWLAGKDYFCQQSYENLVGVGGRQLTYDFLVCNDSKPVCLIECQGEQHYKAVDRYGGVEKFEIQKEHDRRKREYAMQLGLPLFEILPECRTYDLVAERLDQIFCSVGLKFRT